MSVWTKCLGCAAMTALAGCGMMKERVPGVGNRGSGISKPDAPEGLKCDDDKGVEQLGKEMDAKAFEGMIAAQSALAYLYDAAGKGPDAEKTRGEVRTWRTNRSKAPSGTERISVVSATSEKIAKGAEFIQSQNRTDEPTRNALKEARTELRKSLLYIAWGTKIGAPVPERSKEAIAGSKACSAKVKPAADAAAGLTTLLGNMKRSYGAVDAAAKKAGNPELTEAEKHQQESETGAPSGLGV